MTNMDLTPTSKEVWKPALHLAKEGKDQEAIALLETKVNNPLYQVVVLNEHEYVIQTFDQAIAKVNARHDCWIQSVMDRYFNAKINNYYL